MVPVEIHATNQDVEVGHGVVAERTVATMRKKDVRRRMTGFSLPIVGGGAQWESVDTSRAAGRRVLAFLADRRVLFNPYWQEEAGHCAESVLEVRRMLTHEVSDLPSGDPLVGHLDAMRAACRRFLDLMAEAAKSDGRGLWVPYRELDYWEVPLVVALGELRSAVGIQIGLVAALLDLDVPDTLADTLPPPADDGAEVDIEVRRPW